jgi:hypothetical protein
MCLRMLSVLRGLFAILSPNVKSLGDQEVVRRCDEVMRRVATSLFSFEGDCGVCR